MHINQLVALFAVSNAWLGVSASPLAAKRQDEATTSTRSVASVALMETVIDGKTTTIEVAAPKPTQAESAESATKAASATITTAPTPAASKTIAIVSKTGSIQTGSTVFPICQNKDSANPFCLPSDGSTLYYGKTYYATWDPERFPMNSTVQVVIQLANDTKQQVWSSGPTDNAWGFVSVDMKKAWMQGYSMFNLTFHLRVNEPSAPNRAASTFDGPDILLTNEPPNHYKAPPFTKVPEKAALLIGLPVTLGGLALITAGLYFGMRKHRIIGLGNIMGRRKGYGVGKSKRQRMGLGKKGAGAIRLDERDDYLEPGYQPPQRHMRGDSLGSLVSDDGIRPAPAGNHFRSEIDRQRTGR